MHIPQSLSDISNLKDKVVVVRAGLNVPTDAQGAILDDFRIQKFLPTLQYLIDKEAIVVVIAHIGREKTDSLDVVAQYINKHIPLSFRKDFFANDANISDNCKQLSEEVRSAQSGSIYLLDNIRQTKKEKENDIELAKSIAGIADVYVNEAFSVSHRNHTSLVGVPQYVDKSVTGLICHEEVEQLSLALQVSNNAVAIIGGNKFVTKLPLISKFLQKYSTVVVAGALANTLYKISGYEIGASVYESDLDEETTSALKEVLENEKLYLPAIVVTSNQNGEKSIKHISEVTADDSIYDTAPDGLVELEMAIESAKFIVWNGPLGYYEGGYNEGTNCLLNLVVANNHATSIIGGGNTVDAVRDAGKESDVSFLSTGGGAMIEFLTTKTLPALEVLS